MTKDEKSYWLALFALLLTSVFASESYDIWDFIIGIIMVFLLKNKLKFSFGLSSKSSKYCISPYILIASITGMIFLSCFLTVINYSCLLDNKFLYNFIDYEFLIVIFLYPWIYLMFSEK